MRLKPIPLILLILAAACASASPTPSAQPLADPRSEAKGTTPSPLPPTTAPTLIAPTDAPPTPEGPAQYGPDNFPLDVNPLTGLKVADVSVLERRPIAVKVSQFPRSVRPQSGLSLADLVFEHYAEAGVTRLTAIFLGSDSPKVGSIRSARLIDTVIGEAYQAMLVTSGSSEGTLQRLSKTNFYDRVIAEATGYNHCPPLCREGDQPSTNNLFASTLDLWQTTTDLGRNARQNLHGMAFHPEPPPGGALGTTIHIDFQPDINIAEWRYDVTTNRYTRWVDTSTVGELAAHMDAVNEQPLTAANVAVVYANHQPTDIMEDFANGGLCGYEIQLWGTGPAKLFRDGQAYDLTWVRFAAPDLIGFVGPAERNQIFPFQPGNTWLEVIDLDSPTTFEQGVFTARFKGPSQSTNCPGVPPTPSPAP